VDTVHECDRQTDGRTDRRTDRITITKTVQTASHGKNCYKESRLQRRATQLVQDIEHKSYDSKILQSFFIL